nr:methyl-accepting chemotaxis protein [Pseudomonas sp. HAR-UPW-AIA-41]
MLDRLQQTYQTRLVIGGRTFDLIVNPILDNGKRIGTVVEWKDMTAELAVRERELALAAENARIKIALDNVSSNVMIADNERNIIYMNHTVKAMMQNAESDLRKVLPSFDAGRLLGGSIDQFHKNPEHQKHLLATFTSTYRTQIEVGGRTFALAANPVISDSGERLGSVVEWNDRTVEVAVEHEVAGVVTAAANGDFSQRLDLRDKHGFLLNLATGLNQLVETADKGLQDVVRMLGALAQGDLTQRITDDYHGTFGQLKDFANETAISLSRMLGQIREGADTIYTAANEISVGNTDLSSRTEEQASSLEETASSMEELTSTVKLNADNARQANSLAMNASEVASDGGQLVERVVLTMSSINESSRKISDIIGVIDGIAFQTNILALNAAVEAARAGEQGRGFAVVAAEVRNLAQRSAAAAKEIKTLISDSVDKVETGNTLVAQAGKTMSEIVTAIKRVTDIMAEIAAASAEQSTGIEEVNGAVSQMDEMTQQNAALVEQAAAAAESLLDQAAAMTEAVGIFKFDHTNQRPALVAPAVARTTTASSRNERTQRQALPRASSHDDEWEQF